MMHSAYDLNIKEIALLYFGNLIKKHHLIIDGDGDRVTIYNEFCRLHIGVPDYEYVAFSFSTTNRPHISFSPNIYLDVIIGKEHGITFLPDNIIKGFEERMADLIRRYAEFTTAYLSPVLAGDLSWEEKYVTREKLLKKLVHFICNDHRAKKAADLYFKNDSNWEDVAMELMKQLNMPI